MRGHVLPALKSIVAASRLPSTNQLDLSISLPLRNREALSNLLHDIYDPASPKYHQYLTPAEFTEQFGPTTNDYQAVIAFAKAHGLQVTKVHSNRQLVDVRGRAAVVEQALNVTLNSYQHPTENRVFHAPDREPTLDLAVPILHISGLNDYALPRPNIRTITSLHGKNASPNVGSGSGPNGSYLGLDFRKAYVPDSTLDGSGQIVGLLQFDGYTASDITDYEAMAGLPHVPLQNVLIDGFDGNPTGYGEDEVCLDIEMVISMATNLTKVMVYEAAPNGNWHHILNQIANDNLAKQISCSWYIPGGGPDDTADQIFLQMQAQGQSFFNASGDFDAWTGAIPFPCETYYITQVGGTTLTTTGPGGGWLSETVWNLGNGIGSGGGISTIYPIPTWQTNINMTNNLGSKTKRNVPDIAMVADNILVRVDGFNHVVGGTSAAAPLWAGLMALVNQQASVAGKPPVGFINPLVDRIGVSSNYLNAFHDIISGNNFWSNSPVKYPAVAGYDLCTGWGTPAGQKLINALSAPEPLQITPAIGFSAIAGSGGPFSVTSQTFNLTNIGTNTLTWTLSNTSLWLSVSSTNGTLNPGGPDTNVIVSLNATASNLVVGVYNSTLRFTNQNDHVGQSRAFTLSIISPPVITLQPSNYAVLDGSTVTFNAQVSGGLPLFFQWRLNGTNLTDGGSILGSMTTNLTISNVAGTNAGIYTLVATNYAGSVASSNATLIVTSSPPVIVLQPTNQIVPLGGTAIFTASAVGSPPLSYQWLFNGTHIADATNSVLFLFGAQLTNVGNYSVTITNLYGSTNSAIAVLTIESGLPCDPQLSGLIAWWKGENNGHDSIGTNDGTLMNGIGFATGEVDEAFQLNGGNNYIVANPSAPGNLDVSNGFTFECWINPASISYQMPIFEYERTLGSFNGADSGVLFYINLPPIGGNGPGSINANIEDVGFNPHIITSAGGLLVPGVWQHIALTFNSASGDAAIYFNGTPVAQTNFGGFVPHTSYTNLLLGARTLYGSIGSPSDKFSGGMDELSLYNRALAPAEIMAIYQAGSYGKCDIPIPPYITSQPTNQTLVVGSTAAFTVSAGGTPLLGYQWSFNGTNIDQATNKTLTIANVQVSDSGNYSVKVTNYYGMTNSTNAILVVFGIPPTIISQPSNQFVHIGSTASFGLVATGSPPLAYQWSHNGTNISFGTNATLGLANIQAGDAGNYSVLITSPFGMTNSASAQLDIYPVPNCDTLFSGLIAWWQAESNAIDSIGGNDGTLINGAGFTTGKVGTAFDLNGSGKYVLANPVAATNFDVGAGGGFTFEGWINPTTTGTQMPIFEYDRVLGGGGADSGILFYINLPPTGGNGAGSVNANLVDTGQVGHIFTSPGNLFTAGNWQHVAITYDRTSGLAAIYLNGWAVVRTNIGNVRLQTTFTNLVLGARTIFSNPSDKFSGSMDDLALYNRALAPIEIQTIYMSGSTGKCFTPIPPYITANPTNQTAGAGTSAIFTAAAGGTMPLIYQWSFNGTNILNATNAVLTLNNVQASNVGDYSMLVTNLYGTTNSFTASLTVTATPPMIILQPTNRIAFAGSSTTFVVGATGSTLFYQWSFNGTNIPNATNAILSLSNVQITNTGVYQVTITNLLGSTNSAIALFTVYTCYQAPAGLVGWWAAESNALDSVAGNNGTLMNGATYTNGEVGTAFRFNGITNYVLVNPPVVTNLNVGSNALTFECWINPASSSSMPVFTYERILGSTTSADNGPMFFVNQSGSGSLSANLIDAAGSSHSFNSPSGLFAINAWQHVALTYDKATGQGVIYLNGVQVAQSTLGSFTLRTTYTNFLIGARTYLGSVTVPSAKFSGRIDEASLYNRSLNSNEIATLYLAGVNGKCPLPPYLITQPTNQTINASSNATFRAFAGGTPVLGYQWSFNGNNLPNATNVILLVPNVTLTNSGVYTLTVSNGAGMTTSSNAILAVIDALDHFGWDSIPATRFVNTPFNVTVRALDSANLSFSNFIGPVSLTTTNGVPVTPPVSGSFTQGVWSGWLTISQATPSLVLQSSDGAGHVARANAINVAAPPSVSMAQSGGSLLLYWTTDANGFVLESTPALTPPQWSQVSPPPFTIGNQYLQLIQVNYTNQQFYRLRFTLP